MSVVEVVLKYNKFVFNIYITAVYIGFALNYVTGTLHLSEI